MAAKAGAGATTTGVAAALHGALAGTTTFGGSSGSTQRLAGSASAPALTKAFHTARSGVTSESLFKFLFPSSLKNPDSTGRLEVYAVYGPADENGFLRGGPCGAHAHSNLEIAQMATFNCKEALYKCFAPRPRSSVEAVVESLLKVAMMQRYTDQEVQQILRRVPVGADGRMSFSKVQEAILASQRSRLERLVKRAEGGKPVAPPKERPPRVLYQSHSAAELMKITVKKKVTSAEEAVREERRLHSFSGLIAPLASQSMTTALRSNVVLMRGPGDVADKWDRYCALRRTGRATYVKAKNLGFHAEHPLLDQRFNPALDEGLTNKHPGVSSLVAAHASLSSAGSLLAS